MVKTRKTSSLGKNFYKKGEKLTIPLDKKYEVDYARELYIFDVIPMGAVRMTVSDKWKTNPNHPDPKKRQRKEVQKYFQFKNALSVCALQMKFVLEHYLDAVYFIPMPDSWSKKKKEKMNGMPCMSKPDTDNITKALKDALLKDDSAVFWEKAEKRWAFKGSILIYK